MIFDYLNHLMYDPLITYNILDAFAMVILIGGIGGIVIVVGSFLISFYHEAKEYFRD